jgi:hypothetical protein
MKSKLRDNRYLLILIILIILFVTTNIINLKNSEKISQLDQKNSNWIEFMKSDDQLLLVFEYLVENRCSIKEVRYGINQSKPNNILVLPSCEGDIKAIERYRNLPPSTSSINIYLRLIDGSKTNIRQYYVE